MRRISALLSSLVISLVSYLWAIPLCGTWVGAKFLSSDRQSLLTVELLLLAMGASVLVSIRPRVSTMCTVMTGGSGAGAIIVASLAASTASQPLTPHFMQAAIMMGAFIGFTLAVGSALTSVILNLVLDWWVFPRLTAVQASESPVETASATSRPIRRHTEAPLSPVTKMAVFLVAGIALIPIMQKVVIPKFSGPSPNTAYRLTPSVWKGSISFKGESHPFTLVFEQVEENGQLLGYMDWPDHFRLLVEGQAAGNHVVFEDTEFIIGKAAGGLYDKKDVWISGNRMVGTDKNGTATLEARKIATTPPPSDPRTAVGHRADKKAFAANWSKGMRVCEAVQAVDPGRLGPACWKDLAKAAKDLSLCGRTTTQRDQLTCHIDVVWQTGEWRGCRDLGYSAQISECTEAAVTRSGDSNACEIYAGTGNHGSYAVCQAIAKREPEACAKLPPDPQQWHQSRCWSLLAIALKEPTWCEQLPPGFNSACRRTVNTRLQDDSATEIRTDALERCHAIRYSLDQDLCHLTLVSRGAEAGLCARVQNDKLRGTCRALTTL